MELAAGTGADLLWRAKTNMKPRHVETLDDGSWLGEFRLSGNAGRHAEPLTIRVIDYELDDGRGDPCGPYRLFTTLLDPAEAPANELAFANAAPRPCCDPSPRPSSNRRSGATCAATTRSAP